jgi:hypothetical protein
MNLFEHLAGMATSKRIALLLAVGIHILLLYMLGKLGAYPVVQVRASSEPLAVILVQMQPAQLMPIESHAPHRQEDAPSNPPKRAGTVAAVIQSAPVAPTSAAIAVETKASAVSGSGLFVQSALNAVGKMVRDEGRSSGSGSNVMSNSLSARISASIDKNSTAPAGSIDENIYPDGRREERIHGPFGAIYCITFESPSDTKDGFDTMQRGLKPSVPHTCGHRFD